MRRLIPRIVVTAVILLTGWVALGAAIFWTLKPQTGSARAAGAKAAKPPPPLPLFEGWPKPEAVVVISGQQLGFMEPCGCAPGQMGGLTRRHTFLHELQQRGWPIALVDLGSLVKDKTRQDEIKFDRSLKIMQDNFGYAAVGVGPEDLALGSLRLLEWLINDPKLPLVTANVVFSEDEADVLKRYVVAPVSGLRLGMTSVVAGEYVEKVKEEGTIVKPPEEVLPEVLKQLAAESDVQILLAQAPPEESKKLAEQFPEFDVVVTAGGYEDPDNRPVWVGDTLIVSPGKKGKHVVVVGLFPEAQGKDRLRLQLVPLNPNFAASKDIQDAMDKYQDILKEEGLVEELPRVPTPEGATYVGARECGRCHTQAYKKWMTTPHAKAWKTIEEHHRQYDPQCVFCHTTGNNPETGVTYETGFFNAQQTPLLANNGCENCHGPGSKHAADEHNPDYLAMVRRSAKAAKEQHLCQKCHDQDNSPEFDFDKYWPDIVHPGRD